MMSKRVKINQIYLDKLFIQLNYSAILILLKNLLFRKTRKMEEEQQNVLHENNLFLKDEENDL